MGVVKNLMVRAGADFSAISSQAKQASRSMANMQNSVSGSCNKMMAAGSAVNKVLGAIGVGISIGAIVAFAKSSKQAYDEQTEASAKLTQVMRNTMGARADEVASIEELIDAQERLGVVKGDVQTEGAQELSTYLSLSSSLRTLLPVMNDMVAQQYGMSASAESAVSIATMMGKVMNGQTSALSRYGYSFTAAQEAILKYGTEAQRAATLAAVVSESVGGMNATLAATPNGRLQQVSNTMGKIQESFGQAVSNIAVLFIPAMNVACSILANLATLANKAAQALVNVFGVTAGSASKAVSYTAAAASSVGDLADQTTAAGKAAKSLSSFGFDTLQKLSDNSSKSAAGDAANPGGGGGAITEGLTGADEAGESIGWLEQAMARLKGTMAALNFDNLTNSFARLKEAVAPLTQGLFAGLSWAYTNLFEPLAKWTVEDLLPAFLDTLGGAASVLSGALTALQPMASWLWENFLQPIASWTGGVIVGALNGLATVLYAVGDWMSEHQEVVRVLAAAIGLVVAPVVTLSAILQYLVQNWDTVKETGIACWEKVKGAWSSAGNWFTTTVTTPIANAWSTGMQNLKGWAAEAWGNVKLSWSAAGTWFSTSVTEPVKSAWSTGMANIKTWGSDAWGSVKGAWNSAAGWFTTNVTTPITNGFKGFTNGIIGFFEGLANGGINAVNSIIGAFNRISFSIPDWVPVIGGNSWGFSIPTFPNIALPRLANGAVFEGNNPYMAIVNDQKHGVNVESPLSTIVEAMMLALRQSDFGGGNINVSVKAVFEGQLAVLARYMRPYFEAEATRVGARASTARGGS